MKAYKCTKCGYLDEYNEKYKCRLIDCPECNENMLKAKQLS